MSQTFSTGLPVAPEENLVCPHQTTGVAPARDRGIPCPMGHRREDCNHRAFPFSSFLKQCNSVGAGMGPRNHGILKASWELSAMPYYRVLPAVYPKSIWLRFEVPFCFVGLSFERQKRTSLFSIPLFWSFLSYSQPDGFEALQTRPGCYRKLNVQGSVPLEQQACLFLESCCREERDKAAVTQFNLSDRGQHSYSLCIDLFLSLPGILNPPRLSNYHLFLHRSYVYNCFI